MAVAQSAVIIGASMSGLLAARALTNHFERITIVERDLLPAGPDVRKGVPQAAHAHGLLASGYRILNRYFPLLVDELEAAGAPAGDVVGNFLWFQYGRWKLRHQSGLRGITVSRPCLEAAVRKRVAALPNVRLLDATACVKPSFDRAAGRVSGVLVRSRDGSAERTIDADLVVDAGGRGSHSPKWLEEWGYGEPASMTVTVNVGYSTRIFERRPGDFFDSMGGIIAGAPPKEKRLAAVLAAEGNRWMVTLAGTLGDHPPADEAGFNAFAASLPDAVVHELLTTARPLSDIAVYRFPANERRLYERMKRFPAGYLVFGDAICSFNPVYGQGMSVAASEAQALDDATAAGLDGIAPRFFAAARKIVDIPWTIATGEDLRYPEVEGTRAAGSALVNRYFDRVHAAASCDEAVCDKFFQVLNLLAPPGILFTPATMWRVLIRRVPAGKGSPWGAAAPRAGAQAGV